MPLEDPHYLLYAESSATSGGQPRWKFVLQSAVGDDRLTAADTEQTTRTSRLELLAVVRGLEALDQPSRVTLLTRSRYVRRGLRRGLSQWRERCWRWERFGQFVPIRDYDLWQRVDRALDFHRVECCAWHAKDAPAPSARNPLAARHGMRRHPRGALAAMLGCLRHGVLTPISALWPQAFTRAA